MGLGELNQEVGQIVVPFLSPILKKYVPIKDEISISLHTYKGFLIKYTPKIRYLNKYTPCFIIMWTCYFVWCIVWNVSKKIYKAPYKSPPTHTFLLPHHFTPNSSYHFTSHNKKITSYSQCHSWIANVLRFWFTTGYIFHPMNEVLNTLYLFYIIYSFSWHYIFFRVLFGLL